MATTFLAPEATEVHADVDFMTMFTTQNDDGPQEHVETPSTHPSNIVPVASVPSYDPLQVFDATMHSTTNWSVPQHSSLGLHAGGLSTPMPMAPVAYAPQQVMYHGHFDPNQYQHHQAIGLGQPFTHTPAQYLEPSVALQNTHRPDTAKSQFSATSAPETPATTATMERAPTAVSDSGSPNVNTSPSTSISRNTASPPPVTNAATTEGGAPRIVRRKRKLLPEDKRRICEIYRNSAGKIRQEDIAKEYSVDRSTISKILNQEDRWLDPDAPGANPTMARRPGGRYPAIEEEMQRWLDEAVRQGRDVRDSEAREEALKIGHRLGHPSFQASSKWWDGVKRRRVEEGRPLPSSRRAASSIMATSPMTMPGLTRTYTAMSLDSPHHQMFPGMPGPSGYALMDPNVYAHGMVPVTPSTSRARSLSAPQQMHLGLTTPQQQPSFGPAPRQRMSPPRHSPVTPLTRNRSYHGTSDTPQRPSPLNRANSANGKPSPHQRLGASAFGLTPMNAEVVSSPEVIDSTSVPSLSPLSGAPSETSEVNNALSPSTPCTPATANFQVPTVPQPEFLDMTCQPVVYQQQMVYPGYPAGQQYYPTYEYVQQW